MTSTNRDKFDHKERLSSNRWVSMQFDKIPQRLHTGRLSIKNFIESVPKVERKPSVSRAVVNARLMTRTRSRQWGTQGYTANQAGQLEDGRLEYPYTVVTQAITSTKSLLSFQFFSRIITVLRHSKRERELDTLSPSGVHACTYVSKSKNNIPSTTVRRNPLCCGLEHSLCVVVTGTIESVTIVGRLPGPGVGR